jgi:tRNA modification GTPase
MYNYIDTKDTICAIATPAGTGAIAVIRLSGSEAIQIVANHFKGKDLKKVASHTIHLGYILDENKNPLDQVLVSVFMGPNSYTRENVVEISCHGSPYIQQQILGLFLRNGARLAIQGEFTLRAFLHGQLDLSQAEAVADIIAADSEKSLELALKQIKGGFSDEIKSLKQELINFASLIELELDFGEEDVEFANRQDLENLVNTLLMKIAALRESFRLGNVIKNGISTVIAGRPNAGKSTLLNVLLNEERAIVSDIPGTTRDTIEETLNINGILFRLIDTAGIREAADQIEVIGIQKTMDKIAGSSLLIYLYDIAATSQQEVEEDLKKLHYQGLETIVVANKTDTVYKFQDNIADQIFSAVPENHIQISALNKANIEHLKTSLYEAVAGKINLQEQTIVTNLRHYEALTGAQASLQKVIEGLKIGMSGDFLAMDIRQAIRHLGEITGQVDVEDLLENIFSKFCIGK